jgi:hypothetical protein
LDKKRLRNKVIGEKANIMIINGMNLERKELKMILEMNIIKMLKKI